VEGEQLPDESNRVELHPTLTDEFGSPGVKLVFRRIENTTKLLEYSKERAKELLAACGATRVVSEDKLPSTFHWAPGHYMGQRGWELIGRAQLSTNGDGRTM